MTNWEFVELGDVCNIIGGGTPSKDNAAFYRGSIPWATVRDMKSEMIISTEFKISEEALANSSTNLIPRGSVVIATRVGLGKVCFLQYDTAINQDLKAVIPRDPNKLDARYLFWWLRSMSFVFVAAGTGLTVHGVKLPFVKSLAFPFPSLPEQQRIVAILDEAFEGLAIATANTEKNLKNARELFEGYLNNLFSQVASQHEVQQLESLSTKITKGSSPKWQGIDYVSEPGILFVTSENVGENEILLDQPKYVQEAFNAKDSKSILRRGDVLTNIVGASIGRTAVFDRDDNANINQAVCLIRCDERLLDSNYLSFLLNSPKFKEFLHDNEVDNARANLSLGFFRKLQIPVPKLDTQKSIVVEIEKMLEKIVRLEILFDQKLAAIAELKQSLLQKAFAGELTKDFLAPMAAPKASARMDA